MMRRVALLESRVRMRPNVSRVLILCLCTVRVTHLSYADAQGNPQVPSLHRGEVGVVAGHQRRDIVASLRN
jgi:hypothetical protein